MGGWAAKAATGALAACLVPVVLAALAEAEVRPAEATEARPVLAATPAKEALAEQAGEMKEEPAVAAPARGVMAEQAERLAGNTEAERVLAAIPKEEAGVQVVAPVRVAPDTHPSRSTGPSYSNQAFHGLEGSSS